MIFSEKLLVLRKSKGLTQEELAERLSVSRQAIAKWESGQAYPDISNLIGISEFFKVTIDHLVKDNDSCHTSLIPEEACSRSELSDFLVKAKCRTYAAKAAEEIPARPGSHDFRYEEGDFLKAALLAVPKEQPFSPSLIRMFSIFKICRRILKSYGFLLLKPCQQS